MRQNSISQSFIWQHKAPTYNQVITYPRRTIFKDETFDFGVSLLQPAPGCVMTFVHISVFKWSLRTLSRLKTEWSQVRPRLPPIVFAQGEVTDAKWEKFVRHFGFEHCIDSVSHDGESRRIFIHRS